MEYIKSWALSVMTALGLVQPAVVPPTVQESYMVGTTRITLIQGDITKQKVDAIINAANEDLSHSDDVARTIGKAAGKYLQIYSDAMPIISDNERCPAGKAVITPAFDLEKVGIRKIIHTTGPRGTTAGKELLLRDAYLNSLQIAADNGLKSIAFPAISTTVFGYDINAATPIACGVVKYFVTYHPNLFDEIRFVVFSDEDFVVYKKCMNQFFAK